MDSKVLQANLLELIRRTSAELPGDVIRMIEKGYRKEKKDSTAKYALKVVLDNVKMARDKSQPLCQDTGTIICYADLPGWIDAGVFRRTYERAVVQATRKGYLRQNSVDSITGKNSGNNLGPGSPTFHLQPARSKSLRVRMLLKGGGCENVGAQYALPDNRIGAGRDLAGVRLCLLDAVQKAQGKGCGPGILGVCVGGDRGSGYLASKEEFFRTLDDTHPDKRLAKLERTIMKEANTLGIGPMGFGGWTTLLGCKITHRNRLPASFFVSVSYMCWECRRRDMWIRNGEMTIE
jgi:fumarate hydratase class I